MGNELGHYLGLAALLFGIGTAGFLARRNMLIQLMSIELMLNAVNLVFVACNRWAPGDAQGQVFAFLVIAVAAAEAGVGLAVVINLFHSRRTISSDTIHSLRN